MNDTLLKYSISQTDIELAQTETEKATNDNNQIECINTDIIKDILAENLICLQAHLTRNHIEINRQNKENIEEIKKFFKDYTFTLDEQENIKENSKKNQPRNLRSNGTKHP